MKKIIFIFLLFILIFIVTSKEVKYIFYMHKLRNFTNGAEIISTIESIESLGPSIQPLLIKTFTDKKEKWINIHASALLLIKYDEDISKNIFLKYLECGNNIQIAESIFGICYIDKKIDDEIISRYKNNTDIYIQNSIRICIDKY